MAEQVAEFTDEEHRLWAALCVEIAEAQDWFVRGRPITDEELPYYREQMARAEAEATSRVLELRRRRDG